MAEAPAMIGEAPPQPNDTPRVKRRHVFYLPGFDPKGAARYYRLYRENAPRQAAVSGYDISVGPRSVVDRLVTRWVIDFEEQGSKVATTYDVLRWDDIMRRYWPRGPYRILWTTVHTTARHIWNGMLRKTLETSWATFLAAIYPSAMVFAAALIVALAATLLSYAAASIGSPTIVVLAIWAFVFYLAFGPLIGWLQRRFGINWIMAIYGFNRYHAPGLPELEERLEALAKRIAEAAQNSGNDEVLVVGHSTGAQLAVSALAKTLKRDPELARHGPKISLLTLGGSIPMIGWQKEAQWFIDELTLVAKAQDICWVDFTAAQDGACFALQNPLKLCGVEASPERPKVLSTKLFDMMMPETMKKMHRDFAAIHFHYLAAAERKADYDYFAITAGPQILCARFAHRETTLRFDRFKLKMFKPK
jgi:pimeloyl-ACP methyl ester carboxylesterase